MFVAFSKDICSNIGSCVCSKPAPLFQRAWEMRSPGHSAQWYKRTSRFQYFHLSAFRFWGTSLFSLRKPGKGRLLTPCPVSHQLYLIQGSGAQPLPSSLQKLRKKTTACPSCFLFLSHPLNTKYDNTPSKRKQRLLASFNLRKPEGIYIPQYGQLRTSPAPRLRWDQQE
jgi:hypothetical protein